MRGSHFLIGQTQMKKTLYILASFLLLFACSKETENQPDAPDNDTPALYTLPIVIHIIHNGQSVGDSINLAEIKILEQVDGLNNDFRRRKGTLGENDSPISDDAFIQFKLAEVDPDGKPTNGINRVNYSDVFPNKTAYTDLFDRLPVLANWNPEKYINIWVYGGLPPNTLAGRASLPTTNLPGLEEPLKTVGDGVMINTFHFGFSTVDGTVNLGKTRTHEMGHFLGILHIWGNTFEGKDCFEFDDFVEDTPFVSASIGHCSGNIPLACDGQEAPAKNYMNLTTDNCMNVFTKGQIARMRYVLENAERRKTLTTSNVVSRP